MDCGPEACPPFPHCPLPPSHSISFMPTLFPFQPHHLFHTPPSFPPSPSPSSLPAPFHLTHCFFLCPVFSTPSLCSYPTHFPSPCPVYYLSLLSPPPYGFPPSPLFPTTCLPFLISSCSPLNPQILVVPHLLFPPHPPFHPPPLFNPVSPPPPPPPPVFYPFPTPPPLSHPILFSPHPSSFHPVSSFQPHLFFTPLPFPHHAPTHPLVYYPFPTMSHFPPYPLFPTPPLSLFLTSLSVFPVTLAVS